MLLDKLPGRGPEVVGERHEDADREEGQADDGHARRGSASGTATGCCP